MKYPDIELKDNKTQHALELWVEGQRSFIGYEIEGEKIYLMHTEVPESQEGKGIAADLVEKAFQYIEAQDLKVVPACSYVRAFLKRHQEWSRIVAPE
ncbi:GNAT family N-acetyltransferase [Pedobacter quisquiliarum]|jgi:predicted GNAT family acetyltransferase|nr:GNAT family N-acetyltransferase [Pedobacter quisquiliarum]